MILVDMAALAGLLGEEEEPLSFAGTRAPFVLYLRLLPGFGVPELRGRDGELRTGRLAVLASDQSPHVGVGEIRIVVVVFLGFSFVRVVGKIVF